MLPPRGSVTGRQMLVGSDRLAIVFFFLPWVPRLKVNKIKNSQVSQVEEETHREHLICKPHSVEISPPPMLSLEIHSRMKSTTAEMLEGGNKEGPC